MQHLEMSEIRTLYPDEWVLLGNPVIDVTTVLGGTVVYHSKDKKELLKGKALLAPFQLSTWAFTGEIPQDRKIWLGIYRPMV
jgi:hypothetical protein